MNSNFNSLPKVELHVHLDCCLSYKALKKINPKSPEDKILENSWEELLTEFAKKMQEGLAPVNVEFNSDPLFKEINKRLDELKKYNLDILMALLLFTGDNLLEEEYFSQETKIIDIMKLKDYTP